jgi:hypothetical protein
LAVTNLNSKLGSGSMPRFGALSSIFSSIMSDKKLLNLEISAAIGCMSTP